MGLLTAVHFRNNPNSPARKYRQSFRNGAVTQELFRRSAEQVGYIVTLPSLRFDERQHIDAFLHIGAERYSVDIKGRKRLDRAGAQQDQYVCLELHGAHENNLGWLYGGRADLIAFETADSFLLVWRDRLVVTSDFMVEPTFVRRSSEAIYKRYSRRDHEQITWFETNLLRMDWLLFMELQKVEASVNLVEVEKGNTLVYASKT